MYTRNMRRCVTMWFFFSPIKYEECCKWADTAPVNQSWRQRRSTRSLLSRTGRCLQWASDPGSQQGCCSNTAHPRLKSILQCDVKNGTTWQSRKDLLPFSVSANLIPAENISHLQFLRPIFLLTLTIIFYHVVPKSRRKICCCYCCCNLVAVQLANISRTQIPSFDNLLFVIRHLIFLPTYHGILLQGNGMAVKISHEGEMGSETIPLTKVVSITLGRLAHLGSHNSVKPRGKMQRLTRATFLWDGMWRSAQA